MDSNKSKVTIFSGTRLWSKEVLAYAIALMDCATPFGNLKDQAHSFKGKLSKLFGKKNKSEDTHLTVEDKVKLEMEALLKNYDRDALYNQFLFKLREYVGGYKGFIDELSDKVIAMGAKEEKNIPDYLSIEEKADAIYNSVNIELTKKLENLTPEQEQEYEDTLQETLMQLSPEARKELEKRFNTNEVTVQMLRKSIATCGLSTFILTAGTGFSSYVALTSILHAVITTLFHIPLSFGFYTGATKALGIALGPVGWMGVAGAMTYQGLSLRQQNRAKILCMITFLSVAAYGKSFVQNEDGDPLWVSTDSNEYKEYKEHEHTISKLKEQVWELTHQLDELSVKEEKEAARVAELEPLVEAAESKLSAAENQITALKAKNSNVSTRTKEEIKKLEAERNNLKQSLKNIKTQRDEAKKQLSKTKQEIDAQSSQMKKFEKEIDKYIEKNKALANENKGLKKYTAELEGQNIAVAKVFGMYEPTIFSEDVRLAVENAMQNAEEELAFKIPFMNKNVLGQGVNGRKSLITLMKEALERGVVIKINYGFGANSKNSPNRNKEAIESINAIKSQFAKYLGKQLRIVEGDDHSKVLIVDKKYASTGSFNFFSSRGNFSRAGGETMEFTGDPRSTQLKYARYFDFETLTKDPKNRVTYNETPVK